jgi:hypothetical protein
LLIVASIEKKRLATTRKVSIKTGALSSAIGRALLFHSIPFFEGTQSCMSQWGIVAFCQDINTSTAIKGNER